MTVADPRVALVADEQQRHIARYATQYDGKGGIAHKDHGGLWCRCGWDSGPVKGIRPWRDYEEHVAAAVLAVLDATVTDPDCTAVGFSGEGRCVEPAGRSGLCAQHEEERR